MTSVGEEKEPSAIEQWRNTPVDLAFIESLPPKHPHLTDDLKFRAAQSLIDQNMSLFTQWVRKQVKAAHGTDQLSNNEGKQLRALFIYIKRSMHMAVCSQAWHYLNKIVMGISGIVNENEEALTAMSEQLASPESKAQLTTALGIDPSDLDDVSAVTISKAFKKLFGKPFTKEILHEFVDQSAFIRDGLFRMGFA